MKKLFLTAAFLTSFMVSAQSTWKSDPAHSKVGFGITHLMISQVEGLFSDFEVTAVAPESFDDAKFSVDIKTASIDTDNEKRDNHLRSPDYFDAETYPSITFESTNFEKTGDNTFKVTGNLTIHGTTKKVTLDGTVNGIITDQRSNKLKSGLMLTGTINRLEFGVGEKSVSLGNKVEITIHLEMAQQ